MEVGALVRHAAMTAIMPRFGQLRACDVEEKTPGEVVTIADHEAEEILTEGLKKILPDVRVIGEEACELEASLMQGLDKGLVWIVDPLDGTANFAAGRPPFAMMVALLQDGETIGSWILDPLADRLAVAERGSGAWINGTRLHTSSAMIDLDQLCGIVSTAFIPAPELGVVDRLRAAVRQIYPTARCAGHEYPLVASGARHFNLYWRTLVWDHAPGALLLTEAGGSVTHLDGAPYHPARPRTGLLLAHNPLISNALLTSIAHHD